MPRSTIGIIVILSLGSLLVPLAFAAQPPAKVLRIGVLAPAEPSIADPNMAAFQRGLRDLGYIEGQTVAVEYRFAHGRSERFSDLAAEFVRLRVDVMVIGSGLAARAAKSATQGIPIVVVGIGDPVGSGLVESLARPGGNITGLSFAYSEGFAGKWVELLREAVPRVSRVAVLRHAAPPLSAASEKDIQSAAQALGLTLQSVSVSEPNELDGAFATMIGEHAGALIVVPSPFFHTHQDRVVDLAAKHRLPAMYHNRVFAQAGGLMSYGVNLADLWRRAATYVDKIRKGAKPSDLPVEQPMKFELVINLKTAQALGLTIPPILLFQADEVIR